ncbi:MAG TPA: SPW repeat protein [Streptosporangiaceae bacterium]
MSWLLHSPVVRNPAAHPPRPSRPVRHGRIRGTSQPARYRRPSRRRARAADRVWVALSPWFITLQYSGSNATAADPIFGLAVAAVGAFALASPRGFSGLQLGSLLLGIWLIIAPPILDHKHPIAHAMYWSNSFSGGVLIALAAAGLGFATLRRTAR